MPPDIIDNRNDKLVDHLNGILGTAQAAKMAVGNFFLSGVVRDKFASLKSNAMLDGKVRPTSKCRIHAPHLNGKVETIGFSVRWGVGTLGIVLTNGLAVCYMQIEHCDADRQERTT